MLSEKVLILIYRSLRDSIDKSIKDVSFDASKNIIRLRTKSYLEYPASKDSKEKYADNVWEIDASGIKNNDASLNVKKYTWRDKLLCLIWKR